MAGAPDVVASRGPFRIGLIVRALVEILNPHVQTSSLTLRVDAPALDSHSQCVGRAAVRSSCFGFPDSRSSDTAPVVNGIVRIPRRIDHPRSNVVARQVPRQSASRAARTGYWLELDRGMDEERFVVVAPSGARLFWFADLASAGGRGAEPATCRPSCVKR